MKKQRTEEEMGRVLSAFDGSGQSVREFCAASGIAEHLLRYWLKRREKGAGGLPTEASPGFSELKISPKAGGFGLVLPHGLRLGIDGMAPQALYQQQTKELLAVKHALFPLVRMLFGMRRERVEIDNNLIENAIRPLRWAARTICSVARTMPPNGPRCCTPSLQAVKRWN